jgi:hypothetical protein
MARKLFGALLTVAAVVLSPEVARAQSPLDGFDPNANGAILAFAVQQDGKTLIVGQD